MCGQTSPARGCTRHGKRKMTPPNFCISLYEDKAAHEAHASSNAVKQFEAAYRPELDGSDVAFTDYEVVAAKS